MAKKVYSSKGGQARTFTDPQKAVEYIKKIYDTNTTYLRDTFDDFVADKKIPSKVNAYYPQVSIKVGAADLHLHEIDPKLSYGFVTEEGVYSTTLTRPDIYGPYYVEMLETVMKNHRVPVTVSVSDTPIPIQFAFAEGMHIEGNISTEKLRKFEEIFYMPHIATIDDRIVDHKPLKDGKEKPLALYTAQRVDYSLHRLKHYTGTDPKYFQKFILLTNYSFYIEEFRNIALELLAKNNEAVRKGELSKDKLMKFVEPGNHVIMDASECSNGSSGQQIQMPAYHLTREDGNGITLINMGVGANNAKTITDHFVILRPEVCMVIGHCGGLDPRMNVGDYILAHGYDRRDGILDSKLPLSSPVPALAEVQMALWESIKKVTGLSEDEVKNIVRTCTVVTVADRNWELEDHGQLVESFSQCKAGAVDMESATVAANCMRHCISYGTILMVSDIPFKGVIKLPGASQDFYTKHKGQHILIGIEACKYLCQHPKGIHSRKLRASLDQPAFR